MSPPGKNKFTKVCGGDTCSLNPAQLKNMAVLEKEVQYRREAVMSSKTSTAFSSQPGKEVAKPG